MICFGSTILFLPAYISSFIAELSFSGLGFGLTPAHFSIIEFPVLSRIVIHLFCLVLPRFSFVMFSIFVLVMLFDNPFALFPERS